MTLFQIIKFRQTQPTDFVTITARRNLLIEICCVLGFFNIINLGLILLGITITVYSSIILLKNADFSPTKELQIDPIAQNLVTIGLYKYIGHPIYTGIIILYLGYCLFFRSLLCILILNPLLLLSLFLKARQEEKDLKKLFDAVYKKYMLKTGFFLPRIRKK